MSPHGGYWAPRTRKRHQREHRPQRPTERSDPTQHAKGGTGDCPGPRKGTTTRRNVTSGEVPPSHTPGRAAYAQPLSPGHQAPASMAFVTDSHRPQPLWQPPPTACLTAFEAASEVPSLRMHPWCESAPLLTGIRPNHVEGRPWRSVVAQGLHSPLFLRTRGVPAAATCGQGAGQPGLGGPDARHAGNGTSTTSQRPLCASRLLALGRTQFGQQFEETDLERHRSDPVLPSC